MLPSTRSYSLNEKNEHSYTLTYQVISNDRHESPYTVAAAIGVDIGDALGYARCTQISSDCISEDGLQWKVTVTYGKMTDSDPNPLNEPVDIQWSFEQFQKITDRDINGTAILNSAQDPFQEPVEIDDSRPVLTVTRNEASFNSALAYQYRDAVNSTYFYGEAGTVKVSNISSTRQFDQQIGFYWKTTYAFHFNPMGWDKVILDQGFREKVAGKKKNILVQGVPIQESTLLNGAGAKLNVGGNPVFRTFRVYPRLPFTVFNF